MVRAVVDCGLSKAAAARACSTRAGTAARAGWCSPRGRAPSALTPRGEAKQFPSRRDLWLCRLSRSDRILEWSPSLSRGGVRADALDHGARAVRALRREMLLQTERAKGAQGINGENLLWRPIREKRDRNRDQPANDV